MRFLDIRARMLLAALLPVTLVAVLLSSVFLAGRYADLDEAHQQRARSLARQLASASEYGLFSANTSSLQSIAAGALRESDVRSVLILDAQGQTLAIAGWTGQVVLPALGMQEQHWVDARTGHDLLVQPVSPSQLQLDDLFEGRSRAGGEDAPPLGHVVMEVSRAGVVSRSQDMLAIGLAVTLGGLLFGSVLAVRIGRGVIRPILRVSRMIERIGSGELSVRGEVRPDDPLRDLQQGLNQMAEHLQQGRDELERRVTLATAELRSKKEEAETATRAKSRFLAAASHDLRQPIHALGMFVARLAQLPHDRETRHLIGNLEASVRAMQDLLDALLDISRLDADAVRVQLQPVPLGPLFEQLRGALMPVATDKGLRLRVRDSTLWVLSDPTLLHRILLNLVSNALRYTGHGGVLVGCRRSRGGSHLWLEVWDTGVGIPAEHQHDIFREFYQIGNPERDRSKGLGLGLNIVDRTARLLGHELKLCSVPGHGTRFRIELPLAPAGDLQALMAAAEQPQQVDDVRGLRILVIEDDRQSAQALRGLLDSWGCVVAVVEGLQGALTVLDGGFVPDLVLSDFRLRAGESGMQTLHRLRTQLERPLPACLMSGDTDPELIQASRDAGLPLLHKPVRPAKLRTLIRRLARPQPAPG
ncbi:MAG: ATP-binding protein [Hylemonella sp.]|uniref:ATP-binding response regulator n=1 Tax=Hylemonella sp. TaxID=2066020 RepID=UPI0022C5FF39|nr:ATP-binding protein [Hylemonella sp.]MCZ8251505.1 ATP-binding protein [Hylemonella sp.]